MSDELKMAIYKMGLFDTISMSDFDILRVPGGWMFLFENKCAFVPFSNELNSNKKENEECPHFREQGERCVWEEEKIHNKIAIKCGPDACIVHERRAKGIIHF